MLTRHSNGPINSSYVYRNKGRRSYHINRRFKKKVELVQGHTLKYTDLANVYFLGVNGQSVVASLSLGDPVENDLLMDYAKKHWNGYKEVDPNTTSGTSGQFKMKLKVLSFYKTLQGINSSNVKANIIVYQLTPRHDIHQANLLPAAAMSTYLRGGDLADVDSITPLVTDVNFDPFKVPALTQNWIIKKTRGFTVHGGGKFKIVLNHSYDINYGLDSQSWGWDTGIVAKKGHYRAVLIKVTGELGVVTQDANKYIRNLATELIGRIRIAASIHVSEETRDIYLDESISVTRNVAGGGLEIFQGEEDQALRPKDPLLPTSTS